MDKKIFDFVFGLLSLLFFSWFIFICWLMAAFDTKSNGLFVQERIGQFGLKFKIYKLRTIKKDSVPQQISRIGQFLRKFKLDELPQLINILKGNMSFVGPRPDVAGYYDRLVGESRKIMALKPGLTSEASLKYRNEEQLLRKLDAPLNYNDTIIFPDKVQLNLAYFYNHTFFGDLKIIIKTIVFILYKK
ncbi:sugar transferase [Flavobacterium sp. PL002]|uniref:sugar transferase n=1 Tax=Flavobacterium sp. PL002 TaxID=1897058 RepID=UPI001788A105|nr:sugar transferase [Flavobacterium sp. PL002]MBE0390242.1 putative undecaprenyl-phosphate N-acetylgalactosaminyl 1-phosphate transferase [Flavobacterium sp. PL002]